MPSVTYYGAFVDSDGELGRPAGASGLSTEATGAAIPSGMTITGITYEFNISASKYSTSEEWNLHWFAIGSKTGSPSAPAASAAMSSTKHTFKGAMKFSASDISKFASGAFTVYAKANTTHDTTSYMKDFTITVNYEEFGACGAPIVCKLSETISDASVLLSWSGATAGIGNAITGYEVQRCESGDGITWGSWATLTTTTASSLSVLPPTTAGNYYKYRVRTMGAAGEAYYSAWKTCANTLRRDHAPLTGFTDEVLTPGETPVKAIHMQELQQHVATLRAFYGLAAYNFSTIVAGETSLAGWTTHVQEIREAVDGIGKDHDTWLTIDENKPRADVMQQLREVVLAL